MWPLTVLVSANTLLMQASGCPSYPAPQSGDAVEGADHLTQCREEISGRSIRQLDEGAKTGLKHVHEGVVTFRGNSLPMVLIDETVGNDGERPTHNWMLVKVGLA